MNSILNTDVAAEMLHAEISNAIAEAIEEVAEPLILEMQSKVREEVSKKLSTIACNLLTEYDMRMMGNVIEIRVRNTL